MKNTRNTRRLVYGMALGLAFCTSSLAQPGGPGRGPSGHQPQAPSVAMLATNYAALAPFDTNHDGMLDTNEQAAVAQALADGTLQLPGPGRGPDGQSRPTPSADDAKRIAKHLAALYAALAPYDTDKNGQLDTSEQAVVAAALANGTLKLPRPDRPRGDGGGPPPGDSGGPSQ